jgi:hypothetical protein
MLSEIESAPKTIRIPEAAKVFVLEDSPERIKWFRWRIPQAIIASNAEQALALLDEQTFHACFLDHDLSFSGDERGSTVISGRFRRRILPDAVALYEFKLTVCRHAVHVLCPDCSCITGKPAVIGACGSACDSSAVEQRPTPEAGSGSYPESGSGNLVP